MKAMAVASMKKGEVQLQEVEVGDPKDHEVQVRVHRSVISQGTERAFILHLDNAIPGKYPLFPGYSVAGVVERVGRNVTRFQIGDRVACRGIGHRSIGNINENGVIHVPEQVSLEDAAFLTIGVISLQGVRKLRIELGESAMSLGLGLIGQFAVQFAAINGAQPAIGADRVQTRLDMAEECGIHSVVNSAEEGWLDQLRAMTDGLGPHVVIESTGSPDAVEVAFDAARQHGRVVLLGSTRGVSQVNFYKYVHDKGITVIGAHAWTNPTYESRPGAWVWRDDAACFMKLLDKKRLNIQALITQRMKWDKAEEIYKQVLSWDSSLMGVVLDWQ